MSGAAAFAAHTRTPRNGEGEANYYSLKKVFPEHCTARPEFHVSEGLHCAPYIKITKINFKKIVDFRLAERSQSIFARIRLRACKSYTVPVLQEKSSFSWFYKNVTCT
jgi:hypothetical protein